MLSNSQAIVNEKYCYDLVVLRNGGGPYSASYCAGGAYSGIITLSMISMMTVLFTNLV